MSSFIIQESSTTLADLPTNTILVHSTNCFGESGAGIAKAIAALLPGATEVYKEHCDSLRAGDKDWPDKSKLLGTCLLIPPQEADVKAKGKKIWLADLFTSYGYGRPTNKKAGKDKKADIIKQTKDALQDLRSQLKGVSDGSVGTGKIEAPANACYSPKFNSGSFGVKWEETEQLLKDEFDDWEGEWFILAPP